MNTATVFERRPGSRVGVRPQGDYQTQLFPAFVLREPNLGQYLRVPKAYSGDLSLSDSQVEWDEWLNLSRAFSEELPLWARPEFGEREDSPAGDKPVPTPRIWPRVLSPGAFRFGIEVLAMDAVHDYLQASTATNSPTPDGYLMMPARVGYNWLETTATVELVEGNLAVNAFACHFDRLWKEIIPLQTLRTLRRIKELPDNWDGDGATRIQEETVLRATKLIREAFQAAPNKLKRPSVAPAFGGMIVAEWSGPSGRELILDIPPAGEPPGFLLVEPSVDGDEIETDAVLAPPWSMRQLIARLTGE